MNTKNWFLEKIRYYCGIEIYTKFYNLSDEDMAIEIISRQADIDPEGIADLFGDENFGYENDWKLVESIEMIRRQQVDIDTGDITKMLGYKKHWTLLEKDYLLEVGTEDKTENKYHKKYFLQTARQLCDLGFFAQYRHLSDDALMLEIICLASEIEALFLKENYGEMIRLDSARVICTSLELLYGLEPPDYSFEIVLKTLGYLSRISRGKFRPQNIVEIDKEIIQFNLNSKICSLVIEDPPDNPLTLAGQINPIIAETGCQFELYSGCRFDELIVLLSEEDKQKIVPINGREFENCWEHYAFMFNTKRSWHYNYNYRRYEEYYSYMFY